ncbi:MAG: Calcium-gated potassium channel mthK [Jatrophihabitantaceae bacterium]|nr:Calcium-gated potassium channel mthK [Jatrophihabitantaceae bacterium]
MQTDAADWTGHVIVCGLHGVGLRIIEQLHLAGVLVVVVDDDPDRRLLRAVLAWGIPYSSASARLGESLLGAGLMRASAVICVESDDLASLETALLVSELNPVVRVVVQLANAAVGRAVAGVTGAGSVLDVAALSAPSLIEACLQSPTHAVVLGTVGFVVAHVDVAAAGTLRELYADLAPIAVVRAATGAVEVCPGRDLEVGQGDRVVLLGTPAELASAGVTGPGDPAHGMPGLPPTGAVHSARAFASTMLREADRPLRLAVAGLVLLIAVAMSVLLIGYQKPDGSHMSPIDALYFSIETVGTIGYGDFSFAEQDAWLRIFAIGFMLTGAMTVAVFFALLTNFLVSRRIEASLGRRVVTGMVGHVVLIGLGSVGLRVMEGLLAHGRQVVVVERDDQGRYLEQARALGVPVVIGDATVRRTLTAANLGDASAVAVLTSNDLVNLESALAIRDELGDRAATTPLVVRLFDRQLATFVESHFGLHHVRSTAALAAPWFVGAALGLDVLSTFYVDQQPMLVGRLRVAAGGGLDGLAMQHLSARTRVVAIGHLDGAGALEHPPRRDTRFAAGDEAYLVGPYEDILQVLRRDTLSPQQITGASAQEERPGQRQ